MKEIHVMLMVAEQQTQVPFILVTLLGQRSNQLCSLPFLDFMYEKISIFFV